MTAQTCCCCFSLRTGCIIIGVLGIFLDSIFIACHGYFAIFNILSNGLLIVGAAMEMRLCLLPSMIINVLINIFLWILVLASFFATALLNKLFSAWEANESSYASYDNTLRQDVLTWIIVFILAAAVIHVHILRVIFSHFDELREQVNQPNISYNQFPMVLAPNTLDSHPLYPSNLYVPTAPLITITDPAPDYSKESASTYPSVALVDV